MAITQLKDVVVPEVFTPYSQQLTTEKTAIINSGVVTASPLLDEKLSQGGTFFNMPSFLDLENTESRVGTDSSLPFDTPDSSMVTGGVFEDADGNTYQRAPNPGRIRTATEVAVRMNRNYSWGSSKLAGQLAGADPMDAIANLVSDYWARQYQRSFIATWKGIFAQNDVAAGTDRTDDFIGSYTHDITGDTAVVGTSSGAAAGVRITGSLPAGAYTASTGTMFTAEDVIDAKTTMGDSSGDLMTIMVHSVIYSSMQKNNLIEYIPDARGEVMIPTYLGMRVVVDDAMPAGQGRYETWIFGSNTTLFGQTLADSPTVVDEMQGAGNGQGSSVLYSRVVKCFHPNGYQFAVTDVESGGPSNMILQTAASWKPVFPERNMYKVARLITREASVTVT